jgi:hypothetical protein
MKPVAVAAVALAVVVAGAGAWLATRPSAVAERFVRIRPAFAAADGEPPREGFSLRATDGSLHPLRPAASPGVLEATGAPGPWRIVAPPGWSMIGGEVPVDLGDVARDVAIGKRHTVYLNPPDPRVAVRDAAVYPDVAGAAPLPVKVEGGSDGRVAVRVRPEDWRGVVRVVASLGDAALSRAERVTLPSDGSATGTALRESDTAPLEVVLVPAPADGAVPTGDVVAHATSGPVGVRRTARVGPDGVARFEDLPASVAVLGLSLSTQGTERDLWRDWPAAEWRRSGEIRFLVDSRGAGAGPPGTVVLNVETAGPTLLTAFARPVRAPSYAVAGVAVLESVEGRSAFPVSLPPGQYTLRLEAQPLRDGRYAPGGPLAAVVPGVIDLPERGKVTVDVEPVAACVVRGSVAGAAGKASPFRVRLWSDTEPEGPIVGAAWPDAGGSFEARLPPGQYRAAVVYGARRGPVVRVSLSTPGAQASLPPLEAPR